MMESFDLEDPFTSLKEEQSDRNLHALFSSESLHMPSKNYLQCLKTNHFYASFRQEAMSLIFLAQYSCDLDPFTPYLAVNYLDRFLSAKEIPEGKPWVLRLLVTCCISLSAKMKGLSFTASDFLVKLKQNVGGFILDAETIHRMELLMLDALNWRMRSVTPFSFLCFFISFLQLQEPPLMTSLKDRATSIVFKAQNEINLLEFNPSTIAASAILSAASELFPSHFLSFKESIFSCEYVNKVRTEQASFLQEKVLKSLELMQETVTMQRSQCNSEGASSSGTPASVLDGRWTKTECNRAAVTVSDERAIKRRKLNGLCAEKGVSFRDDHGEFPSPLRDST